MTLRLAEPWEQRPLRCRGKRGMRGTVTCELPALHGHGHIGRSRTGAWFSWGPGVRVTR